MSSGRLGMRVSTPAELRARVPMAKEEEGVRRHGEEGEREIFS